MMRPVSSLLALALAASACGESAKDSSTALSPEAAARVADLPELLPELAPELPAGSSSETYVNRFVGDVAGMTLNPKYSFFLEGIMTVGDPQPTLVFVQTDSPNLCAHMAAGTMPRGATMFGTALVQTDGAPVQTHYAYTAPGHHGMDDLPRSMGFFRQLNEACEVSPNEVGAQAHRGQAILRSWTSKTRITADFSFDFEEDGEIIGQAQGHVEAPWCDAPLFFANPEQFYQPVEPEDCRDP